MIRQQNFNPQITLFSSTNFKNIFGPTDVLTRYHLSSVLIPVQEPDTGWESWRALAAITQHISFNLSFEHKQLT